MAENALTMREFDCEESKNKSKSESEKEMDLFALQMEGMQLYTWKTIFNED